MKMTKKQLSIIARLESVLSMYDYELPRVFYTFKKDIIKQCYASRRRFINFEIDFEDFCQLNKIAKSLDWIVKKHDVCKGVQSNGGLGLAIIV
jgi:hypothetical protein